MNGNSTALPGPAEEGAVRPLLRAIRGHRFLVLLAMLAAAGGAVAFLSVREPSYEATANILVNPLSQDDQIFLGLDLLRDSGEPTRTVQTAATLLETPQAAEQVAEALGGDWTSERVLNRVAVEPLGESNIVAVTATADDEQLAARLADEFAKTALALRGDDLSRQVEEAIESTQAEFDALPGGGPNAVLLSNRLSSLRSIEGTGDPTLTLQQPAAVPASPTGAGPAIVIGLALVAGFAVGSGGALLRDLLNRRIGDPQDAVAIYPIPILARIPLLSRKQRQVLPGTNWYMPAPVRQPFQALAVQLEQRDQSMGAILVTSPSKGDGKTTSSINLAVSLASTGRRVALLDCDLHHPQVAVAMQIEQTRSVAEIANPGTDLRQLLVRPAKEWPLYVLPTRVGSDNGDDSAELTEMALRRLPRLIEAARASADCVVIDTPPLGEVSDALRLVPGVDDVLLVVRVNNTIRSHLEVVRELLDRGGYQVEGGIVLDEAERTAGGYGYGAYGYGGALAAELVVGGEGAPPRWRSSKGLEKTTP